MKVIAVTACKEGLIFTYIAAEALKKAAETLACDIQVEIHDAYGVSNKLTKEEITAADVIVIASDISIDLKRFKGKKLTQVSTEHIIYHALEVLNTII